MAEEHQVFFSSNAPRHWEANVSPTRPQASSAALVRMLRLLLLEQSGCSLQILALPAKRVGFFAVDGALIARSDSNGEDLEAFAGAGKPYLYSFGK